MNPQCGIKDVTAEVAEHAEGKNTQRGNAPFSTLPQKLKNNQKPQRTGRTQRCRNMHKMILLRALRKKKLCGLCVLCGSNPFFIPGGYICHPA
jgi:hypothetical protein